MHAALAEMYYANHYATETIAPVDMDDIFAILKTDLKKKFRIFGARSALIIRAR